MQQQVVLVDAVAHGRAAALGGPAAAPGHRVVGGVAVPGRLAVCDQRGAQLAARDQVAGVRRAGAVPVLEDHGRVRPGRLLGRRDVVVLGEGEAQRLLAQHPGTGLQRGHRLLPVQRRRCADQDEVGAYGVQHGVRRRVPRDVAGRLRAEGVEPLGVHVDGGDQFGAVGVGGEGGQVAAGDDGTGADHRDAAPGGTCGHAVLLGRRRGRTRPSVRKRFQTGPTLSGDGWPGQPPPFAGRACGWSTGAGGPGPAVSRRPALLSSPEGVQA